MNDIQLGPHPFAMNWPDQPMPKIGMKKIKGTGFYVFSRRASRTYGPPTKVHRTRGMAAKVAKKMAKKHPGCKFFILPVTEGFVWNG